MKEEKIKRFINDKDMQKAVYEVLLDSFLGEPIANDVNVLAASRLAVDFLKSGWAEMERLKDELSTSNKDIGNIGL